MATSVARTVDALVALEERLRAVQLPLATSDAVNGRKQCHDAVEQLDDYVVPRLRRLDAPLLAVVGGSTGAGKSTLVNAIVGQPVTDTGAVRTTTRSPVLVHHPDDTEWSERFRTLPGTPRLVAIESVPPGLVILDAPDIDSVVTANRELAVRLFGSADLWLFVTTAVRYADAAPWVRLTDAAMHGATVAIVLDRTPADGVDAVRSDLASMLTRRRLGDSPLFVIPEVELDDAGMLPPVVSDPVRTWLHGLVADESARMAVIGKTLDGAISALLDKAEIVATASEQQTFANAGLRAIATESHTVAREKFDAAISDGSVLRGEVLARWNDYVSSGDFVRSVKSVAGGLRGRLAAALGRRPRPPDDIEAAIKRGVQAVLLDTANRAAERADAAWRASEAGRDLLGETDVSRPSDDFAARSAEVVRAWRSAVRDLVRAEGENRRFNARALSLGVNGVAVALMITVFTSTTDDDPASAGRRVLEAVFGDDAVRRLSKSARADLNERAGDLLDGQATRFTSRLDAASIDEGTAVDIRGAVLEVRHARSVMA